MKRFFTLKRKNLENLTNVQVIKEKYTTKVFLKIQPGLVLYFKFLQVGKEILTDQVLTK